MTSTTVATESRDPTCGTGPRRSTPGQGEQCFIYVLGRADEHGDSIVPSYGRITAGCGPNENEDFSDTRWPVVVKVKPDVVEGDLVQHLRDLADLIEGHAKPGDKQRTLGDRQRASGAEIPY